MILTEEGYVTLTGGGTPTYHYYLKDHQGNNRVVVDQSGNVLQVNHYYPFGGLFGEGIQDSNQPYKYSGKELDRQFGLDTYDFHWRQYMADIGRTTTMDPLAELAYHISPFVYTSNNPVNRTDPTGMRDDWVEDEDKHVYWDENAVSESTTKEGESYIGKTVYATGEDGEFKYGDQYGNWHDSAPLGEVSVTGFQSSGSGPVIAGMRQAAAGYDPGWIVGFNQFVDAGLAAINMTLSAATLAANTGGTYNGLRARAALSMTGSAVKGGTSLWPAASGGRTVVNGIEYTTHALERMQPVGTIMKGATSYSRGIPPSVVENAIKFGKVTPGNTAAEVVRTFENVRVITNPAGTRVISVFKIGN